MKKLLLSVICLLFSVSYAQFNLGSVEVQVQGSGAQIDMGQYAELGKFRLSNRTGRNVELESLRLRNYGTADLDESFENVRLTDTLGNPIAELVSASNKYWTWRFTDGAFLGRGDSLQVVVRGTLIYSKRGETVQLGFRRAEDLAVNDIGSGFGVPCDNCERLRLKSHELDVGGIYIDRSPVYRSSRYRGSRQQAYYFRGSQYDRQFQNTRVLRTNTYRGYTPTRRSYVPTPRGSQQYSPGSRDVTFFTTNLNGRHGIAVDGVFLEVGGGSQSSTALNDTFGDWKLLVNGRVEDYANELETYRGRLGVLFNSSMEIPANSQLALIGRIQNGARTGDRIRFQLNRDGLIDPEYLFNGNRVTDINGGGTSIYSNVR